MGLSTNAYRFAVAIWVRVTLLAAVASAVAWCAALDDSAMDGHVAQIVLSAMVATATALAVDIAIRLLERQALGPLKSIPRGLRDAATKQVFDCGYYRKDVSVDITVSEKSKGRLAVRFMMTSTIIAVRDHVQMHFPNARSPGDGSEPDTVDYRHGGRKVNRSDAVPLDDPETHETLVVSYEHSLGEDAENDGLSDLHYWSSLVEGFKWTATLPAEYAMQVSAQSGPDLGVSLTAEYHSDTDATHQYTFRSRRVLFSGQGVSWKVERIGVEPSSSPSSAAS